MEFKADINEHMMNQIQEALDWQEKKKKQEKIKQKIKQLKQNGGELPNSSRQGKAAMNRTTERPRDKTAKDEEFQKPRDLIDLVVKHNLKLVIDT